MKTIPDNEDAQGILRALKVLPDPRYSGLHPLHENRYIVTEDCELEDTIKTLPFERQAEYARLFAAAPAIVSVLSDELDALKTWMKVHHSADIREGMEISKDKIERALALAQTLR